MITVTVYDGHYSHAHQLGNDAGIHDLIEVLEQYRHNAVEIPATSVSIEIDDEAACFHCGEVGDIDEVFAYEIGQPEECSDCRYHTEQEMTN